jgi:two-component system, OmpR family, sensor kinase
MIKKDSIFFTLGVTFFISLALVVLSFFVLIKSDYEQNIQNLEHKYFPIVRMIHGECNRRGVTPELLQNLEALNLQIVVEKSDIENIIGPSKSELIFHKKHRALDFQLLSNNGYFYLHFNTPKQNLLIKDNDSQVANNSIFIIAIFGLIILALILSSLATLKKLYPLKLLKNKVQSFGEEDFDFECCNSNSKDEVSLLAQEFKKSAMKLKKLKESRNVFIRNIMHELKTPITKGKFLVELEDTKKEDFAKVFYRLESLINEFASIEEVIATKNHINKKEYFISDIIDNAMDLLYVDDESVELNITDKKIIVNFKLFSIAIKNLIDNGIKYSPNHKVTISNEENTIIFSNLGSALEHEISSYYEPFFGNDERTHSFGLGLYITKNLLDANGYTLEYEHIDGKNIFKLKANNDI